MLTETERFVLEPEAIERLARYGVPYPRHALVRSAQEAAAAAESIGFPVVMKIVSPAVVHKSDVGGVLVGLRDAGAVGAGYERIVDTVRKVVPGASIEGVLVCEQAAEGVEVIIGVTDDSVFGATIMFGLGGVFAEVLNDVSFRVLPLKHVDAEEIISESKGFAVLSGLRGKPRVDLDALVHLLLSVSDFVVEEGDVKELDLNPVRVYEQGVLVLDVRLIARPAPGLSRMGSCSVKT